MPPTRATTPALVLGIGTTGLGVARTLATARIRALSAIERPEQLRHSRHFVPVPGRPLRWGDPLAPWLEQLALDQAVLFPCSDAMARAVANLPASLHRRFPAVVPSAAVLAKVIDKGAFKVVLEEAGLPQPYTCLIGQVSDLETVPDAVFRSAFLKPRNSQAFFARFGVKGVTVSSRAEAADRLRTVQGAGLSLVLQEYIPGGADAHYFVDGYADRGHVVRALFVRRRLRMFPRDFGNSSYMVSIVPAEAAGAVEVVRRLVASLGYQGIFSIELKHDPRDGQYKVIELNARPWWYVEFAARCGVDVCSLAYREALGLPISDITGYHAGRTLMYPAYDLSSVRPFGRDGHPTLLQWIGQALRADQPVFSWTDPWPGLHEALEWAGRRLGVRRGGQV